MVSWPRADVVILTAIELEYAAVKQVEAGAATSSRWSEEKHNGLPVALREFVGSNGRHLRIAVGRAPDMGKGVAVATLVPLVDTLRPLCIAMCGVCAGRPGKTALGDVVVGERLYDYDAGKWKEVGFEADVRTYSLPAPWKIAAQQFDPKARFGGEDWWQGRPVPYEWQENWVLTKLHAGVDPAALPECKDRCPQWGTVIENLWKAGDVKQKTRSLTKKGQKRAADVAIQYPQFPDLSPGGEFMPFRLHVQPIGSGSAVREDVSVWGFITPHMRTTLAVEMEASALADIVRARAHHDPIEAVVMKGVMDFANHGRDDHFKDYAARASAECLIAFLRDQLAVGAAVGDAESEDEHSLPGGGIDPRITKTKQQVASALPGPDRVAGAPVGDGIGGDRGDVRPTYDLFLAHPGADKPIARALYDLLEPGVKVFLDERSIPPGARFPLEIPRAQLASRATVILLSSRADDAWYLRDEIDRAVALCRAAPTSHLLVPVLLEAGVKVPYGLGHVQAIDLVREGGLEGVADRLREVVARLRAQLPPSPPARPGGDIAASASAAAVAADADGRQPAPIAMASPEVRERLARMKRDVAATLAARPRTLAQLAARIGCDPDPEALPDRLVNLRGSVVAEHILAVYDTQPSPPEGDADRDALQSVLFTVLPYVTDWRDEVAACCARGQGQADVVELRYRSDTIAEAVMAGWVGRRCLFEHKPGAEPYGVGAVQIPAAAQTALFTSEQHLLEQVVDQLRRQLGTGGLDMDEQRLEVEAELRLQRERDGLHRMRYYFLFRDAASPGAPEALWRLARTTLHRGTGLPSLVLVRMQGRLDADQADLNRRIAAMLKPRTPPRS